MADRAHRPFIDFNKNDIRRRRYGLSKQLQDLPIDVPLLWETHLKHHERFFIPNYCFYRTDRFPGWRDIPHKHVDLRYVCNTYTWQWRRLFIRDKHTLSSERYYIRTMTTRFQLQEKNSGPKPQGTWRQEEVTGGKSPVVKYLWLWMT
jgi:hypothetical protein